MTDIQNKVQLTACKQMGLSDSILQRWNPNASIAGAAKKKPDSADGADGAGVTIVAIDGPILSTNFHAYYDYVEGMASPGALRNALTAAGGGPVELRINSPGGSVYDGITMQSELRRYDGAVNVVVTGACFSAATFFLCLKDTHRLAMPGSEIMIHNAWSVAMGDYRSMERVAVQLRRLNDTIAKNYAKRSNLDKDDLLEMMDAETWMTCDDALGMGFVDEVFEADEDEEVKASVDEPIDKPDAVQLRERANLEALKVCYDSSIPEPAASANMEA